VVWYDMSELTQRPDRSDDAVLLYDRQELSGDALRRETGFDEADKPTGADLLDQALKLVLRTLPDAALTALRELTGATLETPSVAAPPVPAPAPDAAPVPVPVTGPPNGNEAAPVPDVGLAAQARAERLIRQARAVHAVRFGMAGWELLHPAACDQHTYSCPFTQGALSLKSMAYPGTPGLYECTLDAFGRFRVGDRAPHKDVSGHRVTRSVTL
jgi:hypothetical protein